MIWFLYLNLLFITRQLKTLSAVHAHTLHCFSKTLLHTSNLLFSFLSLYYLFTISSLSLISLTISHYLSLSLYYLSTISAISHYLSTISLLSASLTTSHYLSTISLLSLYYLYYLLLSLHYLLTAPRITSIYPPHAFNWPTAPLDLSVPTAIVTPLESDKQNSTLVPRCRGALIYDSTFI